MRLQMCHACHAGQHGKQPSGQATVETALLIPMLIVLLLGIIMVGFNIYAFVQVTNAAREGARAGSLFLIRKAETGLTLDQTVQRAVCDSTTNLSALGFLKPASCNSTIYSVTANYVDANGDAVDSAGDQVTATVTYSYTTPVLSSFLPMFQQPMVIVRSVMMEMQ